MRKTLGTLVLAVIAGISLGCAKPQIQNEVTECKPTREMVKEAAKYIMAFKEKPNLAAKGLLLPYDVTDNQHVRCLDQILRNYEDGRYGILSNGEEYIIIEIIY